MSLNQVQLNLTSDIEPGKVSGRDDVLSPKQLKTTSSLKLDNHDVVIVGGDSHRTRRESCFSVGSSATDHSDHSSHMSDSESDSGPSSGHFSATGLHSVSSDYFDTTSASDYNSDSEHGSNWSPTSDYEKPQWIKSAKAGVVLNCVPSRSWNTINDKANDALELWLRPSNFRSR